jgi:hypothetical protein
MLAALRRSRLLASLLLVASPAGAGTLLPVLHPCPVDSPWLLPHDRVAGHAGHQHASRGARSADQHKHHCSCIGSCTMAAALLVPRAPLLAARVTDSPAAQRWVAHDASSVLAPCAALLPPATAPPLG